MEVISKSTDQFYFDSYGDGEGYENSYSRFGFNLHQLWSDWKRCNLMPKTVLDVGCATGYSVRDLRRIGIKAYGIELCSYAISKAPESVQPYVMQMDMRDIGKFKKDSFENIFSNSLMYLTEEEINRFLENVRKPCSQSLYVITPYLDYPETIPDDPYRETLQTKEWWRQILKNHGWANCIGTNLYKKI